MAFAPGVTIKDFQSDISQGYPNPKPVASGLPPSSNRPGRHALRSLTSG
jgi:hypothetical protein